VEGTDKSSLVALRARRERVIDALSNHFATDTLEMDEFEQRVDLAHQATSVAALDHLLSDLPALATAGETLPAAAPRGAVSTPRTGPGRLLSIMSSTIRKGAWRVPEKLRVVSLMSSVELDFREAKLGPGVTEIQLRAVMASVSIVVPPHLSVDCTGIPLMGHFEGMSQSGSQATPDAPVLRITGLALMGSVEIAVDPTNGSGTSRSAR
jgi:hypothetical protein